MRDKGQLYTWDDVTVGQYLRIAQLNPVAMEDIDYMVALGAIMTGQTPEEFERQPLEKVGDILARLRGLDSKPQRDKRHFKRFQINGRTYTLTDKASKLTAGQWVDYQMLGDDMTNNLQRILAIVMIPEGHKYNDGYDIDEVISDMGDMPVTTALGICFFFRRWWEQLMLIHRFGIKRVTRQQRKNQRKAATSQKAEGKGL